MLMCLDNKKLLSLEQSWQQIQGYIPELKKAT
jgi:hypothetical protein